MKKRSVTTEMNHTYSEHQDLELVTLLKEGDDLAFTEIYNRYWDKLFAVAYHRVNDDLEAEEIIQDVFLSLWKRRSSLKLQHSIATYLSVAVKYQVINRLSKQHRKALHLDTLSKDETGEESTELWFNERELKQQIEKCINSLPEKCRIVFLLSREEGKTAKQIAKELNISEKTVEAHMSKALRTLRDSLNVALPILLYMLRK